MITPVGHGYDFHHYRDAVDLLELPAFASQYGGLSATGRLVGRDGNNHATTGTVPMEKFPRFANHMTEKHPLGISSRDRSMRRKLGLPAPHLLIPPSVDFVDGEPYVSFVLLSNVPLPGEPSMRPIAPEFGANHRPLQWRGRYELRRRPTGEWTWYLTDESFARYAAMIAEEADRGRIDRVHALLNRLTKLPLFHGVSMDARKLIRHAASTWAHRTRRRPGPAIDKRLNVTPYFAGTRPRRGVGGRLYARRPDGTYKTLREMLEEFDLKHGGGAA